MKFRDSVSLFNDWPTDLMKGFPIVAGQGIFLSSKLSRGWTAVAQWLRCCATYRKVAGSILARVIEIKSFRSHYGPGVDSASNRKEYQENFLRVKAAGA